MPMPNKNQIVAVKQSVLSSECANFEARKGKYRRTAENQDEEGQWMHKLEQMVSMRVHKGIATIPFRGYVTPDDPYAVWWGETNLEGFLTNLRAADADPAIHTIICLFYSPGGNVHGVESCAMEIRDVGTRKRVIGFTDTLAASAAYWAYAACGECYVGSETTEIGGVGVYMAHFDYSEMLDNAGVKVTEITSGKFKGLGSPYAAPTKDEKEQMQADCDFLHTRFVTSWSTYRGVALEAATKVSNGLTYFGSAAVELGLADGIKTYQEIVTMTEQEQKQLADANAAKDKATAEAASATAQATAAAAENETLKKQLADLQAKQASADTAAVEAEANAAYKATVGRDATKEEIAEYVASAPAVRTAIKAALGATGSNTAEAADKAKLKTEVAKEGKAPSGERPENPIVAAARAQGLSR